MTLIYLLAALGTLAGLAYWGLGIAAASHFKNKKISTSDRFISTMMLWSLSFGSYELEGQKLCSRGNIALIVAVVSWVSWFMLRNK
jgi:hypothetical protein